jgi:hypothetical protein
VAVDPAASGVEDLAQAPNMDGEGVAVVSVPGAPGAIEHFGAGQKPSGVFLQLAINWSGVRDHHKRARPPTGLGGRGKEIKGRYRFGLESSAWSRCQT